ncbi:MAG: Eco57I restriction-modification methylase domain-containing protein, partial [Candidatus Syntropharchaeales archaeon]
MVQLSIQAINNQNLFSNHYLENLIQKNGEWRSNDHKAAFDEIKRIYEAEKLFLEDLNESQLEKRFFRRIFKVLLPDFEVQAGTESQDFPDYAFFTDAVALNTAHSNKGNRSFYKNAFAIGEVKRWDANLDRFGKDKHNKNRNPSFQIWLYLHETEPKWGILSNGRLWRLYHQDKFMDSYYEVDLVTILEEDDTDAFRYFYYFFRREAFLPSPRGEIFLEKVLKGSENYATEIGEDLKENVYRAMKIIAEGFFNHPYNRLDKHDEKARLEVQSTTMRLLYRFLFLLYAEGKGLLSGSAYLESPYSLYSIKKKIKEEKDSGKIIFQEGSRYWTELQDLFGLIDHGNEELGIPAYNGGLFDSERNPNLLRWKIGDRYIADAVDLLSRSRVNGETRGFVDYSTLDIRHLGSIYEGLLEYKLRVAEQDMVATGGKRREWVTLEDFNSKRKQKKTFSDFDPFDRVKKGELYLSTDKGERKATGSYYTPDYIVNYIVKNTIDPVVDERWQKARACNESLIDATLSVKVLDPAMGSGHFLVGALDHLSARMMEAVRREIESGRIAENEREQYTLEWAKREVASHCIYGVDLNDLAVELAKVSLWLKTIAKDKPLSFLDHRLKCGNSLIGAKMEDLGEYPKAEKKGEKTKVIPPMFIEKMVSKIKEISDIGDETLDNIKDKERLFNELKASEEFQKIKALCNLHTSLYFGNEIPPEKVIKEKSPEEIYHNLVWAVKYAEDWTKRSNRPWFREAQRIAEEKSFFHWDLEFPEIFFEEGEVKENPGWDCVVGNPPYGISFDEQEKPYLETFYPSFARNNDIYTAFSELSLKLSRDMGHSSFIIPNTFILGAYFDKLKYFFIKNAHVERIVDFGFVMLFPDPNVYSAIYFCKKDPFSEFKNYISKIEEAIIENGTVKINLSIEVNLSELPIERWKPSHPITIKAQKVSIKVDDIAHVKDVGLNYWTVGRGKKRGESIGSRILYDGLQQSEKDIPFLKGSDFNRYDAPNPRGHWLRHNY